MSLPPPSSPRSVDFLIQNFIRSKFATFHYFDQWLIQQLVYYPTNRDLCNVSYSRTYSVTLRGMFLSLLPIFTACIVKLNDVCQYCQSGKWLGDRGRCGTHITRSNMQLRRGYSAGRYSLISDTRRRQFPLTEHAFAIKKQSVCILQA